MMALIKQHLGVLIMSQFRSRTRQKIVNNYNNRKWAEARRAFAKPSISPLNNDIELARQYQQEQRADHNSIKPHGND
jgi:hypothetical protein